MIALAEPVEREPAGTVRARYPHFSASALNAYSECERKWYYRYVCAAVDDPGSAASAYGSAFHLALERFHERYVQPRPTETGQMLHDAEREVETAFGEYRDGFPTAVEFEIALRRAQRTVRRYVDWVAAEALRAPFTVIGRELAIRLEDEGFTFVGYIDRVDRDERTGAVTIIDYKTGTIAASAAEYLERVRQYDDFQLPFYYWARTAAGDRVSRLALLPLKSALVDVRPVSLEVVPVPLGSAKRDALAGTIGVAELERARKRMLEICRELTSAEPRSFPATSDPSACVYCAYVNACVRRPPSEGERFSR